MDNPPEVTALVPGPAIAIRGQVSLAQLPEFFAGALGELAACGATHIAGPPMALYHSFDPARIDVEIAMPVREAIPASGRIKPIALDGGPAVQVRHVGTYEQLGTAYQTIQEWIEDHHRATAGVVREVYLTPASAPAGERVTLVVQPLA